MLTKILEILEKENSYSVELMAEKLNTEPARILAALQYLESSGYIEKVMEQSSCMGNCKHCSGCTIHRAGATSTMWELVKSR